MLEDSNHMALHRSLDKYRLIVHTLHDVSRRHGSVFNYRSLRLTLGKVRQRLSSEGISFLTKTLPSLGRAFDKALAGGTPLTASTLRFKSQPGSQLPRFLGELFNRVLNKDGTLLQEPCTKSVQDLRLILYLFYKYEIPYQAKLEQQVLDRFIQTEQELSSVSASIDDLKLALDDTTSFNIRDKTNIKFHVARRARDLLAKLFHGFDARDIIPRHGPGAVSTRQQLWSKYEWTNVSARIRRVYPLDEYFYSSMTHVCDRLQQLSAVTDRDLPARVILVPKDSRGPRLISCEPVDFQWVQQGLGQAIVDWVESHNISKYAVHFTDQGPNQRGALLGSSTGRYATLDLKDASDRVTLSLVHLLFPPHLYEFLENCRSSATVTPDGMNIPLYKFAPMGSCLCFPIMALTIWSILHAGAPDAYTRERILVYGDDVIVPTAYAESAIELLESFGLLVNRDKSCIKGLFRESCGVDAFRGVNVTPVRLRTVWSSSPSPESYASWVAYANSFYARGFYSTYDYIVGLLAALYAPLATKDLQLDVPSLPVVPLGTKTPRSRSNIQLQRKQYYVLDVKSKSVNHEMDGWSMLLRYFTEGQRALPSSSDLHGQRSISCEGPGFRVRRYTRRRCSILQRVWR